MNLEPASGPRWLAHFSRLFSLRAPDRMYADRLQVVHKFLVLTAALMGSGLLLEGQQAPVFRAGAEMVPVDVVVTDTRDEPITDLKASEFEIYDAGRLQTITDFEFVSIPLANRSLVAFPSQAIVPDVASNARPSPNSRLFVLLIDDLHTLEYEIIAVKKVMTDFVRALSPLDEVAVVFVGRSDLSLNFTTDNARIFKAIEDTREALGFAIDALGRSNNDSRGRNDRAMTAPGRAVAFAFKNISQALARSGHQRRAIVYVSGGSPIDHAAGNWTGVVAEDLKDAFEHARRANVPIYSLDPRGLAQPADAVRGGIGSLTGGTGSQSTYGVMKQIEVQQGNLSVASVNTGGRAFVNQSDLTGAVNAIVRENGSFYVLGYIPSPSVRDGRFHPIEVKVTREGARVRARAGYIATSTKPGDTTPAEDLAAAMSSGVDTRGLTLRAQVAPLLPIDKGMRSIVTIQVTYPTVVSDLPFDDVQVQILALDADGKVRASSDRKYTFKAPRSEREAATFLVNGTIDLPAQPLTLRIGVSSRALGRTGTVQIPITVPKPSDSQLQMGAVVIGLTGPPRESALGDALVRGLVPFQPTTTRQFGPRATLRVFAPFFWRAREDHVKVTLTLRADGMVLQRDESLAAAQGDSGRHLVALDTLIPLAKLPGPVTLQIEGKLANGQTAQQTVGFDVRR